MTRPAMAVTESDVISIGEKNPAPKSWLSLDTGLTHITPNIDAKYIAFIPEGKPGIRILNVASGKVFEPSGYYVGGSFFWSPDGARIFYR